MLNEPEYIPIAYLNALVYCPRRFVYEFVQSEMLLNAHVVEGKILHTGADSGDTLWAAAGVQQRRVYVWSERLRRSGFIDVLERDKAAVYPVEYKKGRVDHGESDAVQLCAQALCLEERLNISIPQGELFSFSTRRRIVVHFDLELRAKTEQIAALAFQLALDGRLPAPIRERKKCRDCSLQPLCLPDELRYLGDG